ARDVLGGPAEIHLLADQALLEGAQVLAQPLESQQGIVALHDLARQPPQQPLPRREPRGEVGLRGGPLGARLLLSERAGGALGVGRRQPIAQDGQVASSLGEARQARASEQRLRAVARERRVEDALGGGGVTKRLPLGGERLTPRFGAGQVGRSRVASLPQLCRALLEHSGVGGPLALLISRAPERVLQLARLGRGVL